MRSFTQIFIGRALCVLLRTVTGKVTQDRINTHFLLLFLLHLSPCYHQQKCDLICGVWRRWKDIHAKFEGTQIWHNRFIFWFKTQINFYHSRNQDHWSSSRIHDVALWETEHWLRVSCYLRSPASNLAHVRS